MTGSTQWRDAVVAKQTTVTFVDDIDSSTEGVERYTFNWLGTDYEIDLAPRSAKKLIDVMKVYAEKATRVSKSRSVSGARGRGSAGPRSSKEEVQAVRWWAREQGLEVPARGRVSQAVKEAYDQSH